MQWDSTEVKDNEIYRFVFFSWGVMWIPIMRTFYNISNVIDNPAVGIGGIWTEAIIFNISIVDILWFLLDLIYYFGYDKVFKDELFASLDRENKDSKSSIIHKPTKALSMRYLLFFNKLYVGKEGDLYIADNKIIKKFLIIHYFLIGFWMLTGVVDYMVNDVITFSNAGMCIDWKELVSIRIFFIVIYGVFACRWINKNFLYVLYKKCKGELL